MSTPVGFQLGILPERKLDRRALAASYGLLVVLIIVMINIGWIWPDSMNIARQYHVTEIDSDAQPAARTAEGEDSATHRSGQAVAGGTGF